MASFYWKGSTGGTASNYAWNVPQNWVKLVKPNPYSSFSYFVGATNAVPSGGDDVYIGGFLTGPTAVSPLVYGGYSGSGNTGSWLTNLGATGATTAQGQLRSLTICWESGAQFKYPFTHVGGGKTIVWDMTGSNFSVGSVGPQTPGLTPDSLPTSYFDTLTVLADNTYEFSSPIIDPIERKTIKLNYALGSTGFVNSTQKGTVIKGSRYMPHSDRLSELRASSTSRMILSGFIQSIKDESKPADQWWQVGGGDFGDPEVYFQGCTFAQYNGNTFATTVFDQNSTAALIHLKSWYNYPSRFVTGSRVGGTRQYIIGEVNAGKAFAGLAMSITGGITGAGSGTVIIDADWTKRYVELPVGGVDTLNSFNEKEWGGFVYIGDELGFVTDGFTGTTKIGELTVIGGSRAPSADEDIFGFVTLSNKPSVGIGGNAAIGNTVLDRADIWPLSRNAVAAFGQLTMKNDSVMHLNVNSAAPDWTFGVTAGTGNNVLVGGILGEGEGRAGAIIVTQGLQLFNKNLVRTFKNTTYASAQQFTLGDRELAADSIKRGESL